MKIPMTPPGIETATFRLVAQCPNQLRTKGLLSPCCVVLKMQELYK
jgi:hypothetical protein